MSAFTPLLGIALSGEPLSEKQMHEAMDLLLEGKASDIEIAGFLSALRTRRETPQEIAAAAIALRNRAVQVTAPSDAIDTAGTGGDGAGTYNISTAAALIIAGAGLPVAKHGNKALTSKSGSSEVLEALGVKLDLTPERISKCITEANIGFMFAAYHHRAVKYAAAARQGLGIRTLFNIIGPLSNPANAKYQLLGVFSRDLMRPIAEALPKLGVTSAWVVHGSDGLDEITTTGETYVLSVKDGVVSEFVLDPQKYGITKADAAALQGGDPGENADAIRKLLEGKAGAYRDIAALNAAAALVIAGRAASLKDGLNLAFASIDDGSAARALQNLVEVSNAPS